MHRYEARIAWQRDGAKFSDHRYSRGHAWSFDGGATVPASSSPASVPFPYSVAAAVDPEEALVAATSSCHMLWFLALAAKQGFVVDRYVDDAFGIMDRNAEGKQMISRITLQPAIDFAGATTPSPEQLQALHRRAHEECYIANSLKSEVVVMPAGAVA